MRSQSETGSNEDRQYWCFLSYRHADNREAGREWATWLHYLIETYEVPEDLVGTKNRFGETIPERIYPVFRDEEELAASSELAGPIEAALRASKSLVVLCSPRAVQSPYVAGEILSFAEMHGTERVFAALLHGEPNADRPHSPRPAEDECLPEPMRSFRDSNGQPAEVLAADFRRPDGTESWTNAGALQEALHKTRERTGLTDDQIHDHLVEQTERHELARLKILSGVLGVPLADLTQREKAYRLKQAQQKARVLRRWLMVAGTLLVLAIAAGTTAWIQRGIAVEQTAMAQHRDHSTRVRYADSLLQQGRAAAARSVLLGVEPGTEGWEWCYLMATCGPPPQTITEPAMRAATLAVPDLVPDEQATSLDQFLARNTPAIRQQTLGEIDHEHTLLHIAHLQRQRAGTAPILQVARFMSTKNGQVTISAWSPVSHSLLYALRHDFALQVQTTWTSPDHSLLLVQMKGAVAGSAFSPITITGDTYTTSGLLAFPLADRSGRAGPKDNLLGPGWHNGDGPLDFPRDTIVRMQRRGSSGASRPKLPRGELWQRGWRSIQVLGHDCIIYLNSTEPPENGTFGPRADGPELVLCNEDGSEVLRRYKVPNAVAALMSNQDLEITPHPSLPWVLVSKTHWAAGTEMVVVDLDSGEHLYQDRTPLDSTGAGFAWEANSKRVAIIDKTGHLELRDGFSGRVLQTAELTEFAGGFGITMKTSPSGDRIALGSHILDANTMQPVLSLPPDATIADDWRSVIVEGPKRCREVLDFRHLYQPQPDAWVDKPLSAQQRLMLHWLTTARGDQG